MASKKRKSSSKKATKKRTASSKKATKKVVKKKASPSGKTGSRRRKSVRRTGTGGTVRRTVPPRPSTVEERNRAIDTLGEETLRPGVRVDLGKTPRLTPTKNGFRALERYILALQRSDRRGDRALYGYDIRLRFRLPDGTFFEPDPISGVVRAPSETDTFRKKGESSAHAWRYALRSDIQKALFRLMDQGGISGDSESIRRRLDSMTKEEVRDAFRRIKSQHSFTFSVTFYRGIPQGRVEDGFEEESEE